MRLTMIDRIVELAPGERITAIKSLSLAEDYLRDHFPRFPIMPGVLMLEAMYQTAAWLVRATDDFTHSMVTLVEVNNVKYSDFVQPGQTLRVTAELIKQDGSLFRLKCQGEVGSTVAVRGRLLLQTSQLAEFNRTARAGIPVESIAGLDDAPAGESPDTRSGQVTPQRSLPDPTASAPAARRRRLIDEGQAALDAYIVHSLQQKFRVLYPAGGGETASH